MPRRALGHPEGPQLTSELHSPSVRHVIEPLRVAGSGILSAELV